MTEAAGSVWVTNYSASTVVEIDGATNSVVQTVSLGAGASPCGITYANGKLWVGALGRHSVFEVDPHSGEVGDPMNVGGSIWDIQYGFDSVWVAVQSLNQVVRIDPADGAILATIESGPTVSGLAITPTEVWVANQGGTTIDRIDPGTNKITGSIDLPSPPFWFAVGDSSVLVTLSQENSVVLIDPVTGQAGDPVSVGKAPRDPGFVNGSYWVANQGSSDVCVVSEAGMLIDAFPVSESRGIFVAQQALGDGWILDYSGTKAFRFEP
jgi:YVTN family beta-propeller protein